MDATTESPEATTAEQSDTPEEASAPQHEMRVEEQLLGAWADVRVGLRTRKPAAVEAFVEDFKKFIDEYQTGSTPLPIDDTVPPESIHHTHRWPLRRTEVLISATLTEEIIDDQYAAYSRAVADYCNSRGDVAWSQTGFNAFVMGRVFPANADGCS